MIVDWRSVFDGVASFANIVLLNVELVPANCIIPMSTYTRFLLYVLFIPIGLLLPALFYVGETIVYYYKGRDLRHVSRVVVKKCIFFVILHSPFLCFSLILRICCCYSHIKFYYLSYNNWKGARDVPVFH